MSGRVQKVGFRACVRGLATDMHITGTVTNLPDGRVQIYATGESMILEKFISMIYGCPRAIIRDFKYIEIPLKTYSDFSIIKAEGRMNSRL